MSLLALIWTMSLAACAISLLMLAVLVVHRAWANRRAEFRRVERERIKLLLKTGAEAASPKAGSVLTDLGVEILELVRGDEKARFAERLGKAGVAGRLHARLRRGRARTRILAAAALANFQDEETRLHLTRALDDRNADVRMAAALSLAANGLSPPPEEVIRRLRLGEEETSRLTVMLLAEMGLRDVESVRSLLEDGSIPPSIKSAAAEALALCDDFEAVPLIATLAVEADPWADELPHYVDALGKFRHPAGSAAVLQCLDAPTARVRAAAARAAGRIEIESGLDRIERMLRDSEWWVRFHAAQAMLRLGPEGEDRLRRAASSMEGGAGETATLALAEKEGAR